MLFKPQNAPLGVLFGPPDQVCTIGCIGERPNGSRDKFDGEVGFAPPPDASPLKYSHKFVDDRGREIPGVGRV